jgi:hypothetical protein
MLLVTKGDALVVMSFNFVSMVTNVILQMAHNLLVEPQEQVVNTMAMQTF